MIISCSLLDDFIYARALRTQPVWALSCVDIDVHYVLQMCLISTCRSGTRANCQHRFMSTSSLIRLLRQRGKRREKETGRRERRREKEREEKKNLISREIYMCLWRSFTNSGELKTKKHEHGFADARGGSVGHCVGTTTGQPGTCDDAVENCAVGSKSLLCRPSARQL